VIIHAVSAASIFAVSAKAGVVNANAVNETHVTKNAVAVDAAARGNLGMVTPRLG
jgi:hypothetical protein